MRLTNLGKSLLAIGAMMLWAGMASAATITAAETGIDYRTIDVHVGIPGPNNDINVQTKGGMFTMNRTGGDFPLDPLAPGSDFYAFCIELEQNIPSGSATWDVVDLKDGRTSGSSLGVDRANDLAVLFDQVNPFAGGLSDTMLAVFQMVVWEIAYETGPTYSLGSGNATFSFTYSHPENSAAMTAASNWLSVINAGSATPSGNLQFFAMNNRFKQDLLIAVPGSPDEEQVPEPATLGLTGLGLLGFALWRRKRATA